MTNQNLLDLAQQHGFDHVGMLNMSALEFSPEVRSMCSPKKCRSYGKCWTCPPYCGSLEEIKERSSTYHRGILVQTTGQMEDDYDVETMEEAGKLQIKRFRALVAEIRKTYPNCLPMAAGACSVCPVCACPDEPCRFPDLAFPSMEAYGLWVSKTCTDSGLSYYYGPQTITYTCCILID